MKWSEAFVVDCALFFDRKFQICVFPIVRGTIFGNQSKSETKKSNLTDLGLNARDKAGGGGVKVTYIPSKKFPL